MRAYDVRIVWQNQGKGYERTRSLRVKATSVRAAISCAMKYARDAERSTWREKSGGYFRVYVIVGESVATTKKEENQDLTKGGAENA